MGMPCVHEMKSLEGGVIHLDDTHPQLRLDTRSFLESDFGQNSRKSEINGLLEKLQKKYVEWPLTQQELVQNKISELVDGHNAFLHEPLIQPHKGRPTGSKNKKNTSTTRLDPSAFEFLVKIRKCSLCKDHNHDKRSPYKNTSTCSGEMNESML